ncbi:MAG: hypothetical protein NC313_01450 [Butyrivibrio sp.]|nr:hypothetical protein [Butyrivibrio sp.]
MYEEGDWIEKSIDICIKGIQFDLRRERGLAISVFMEQIAFGEERLNGDKEASRRKYQQAYQYMKLMKREASIRTLKIYYEEHYGEILD